MQTKKEINSFLKLWDEVVLESPRDLPSLYHQNDDLVEFLYRVTLDSTHTILKDWSFPLLTAISKDSSIDESLRETFNRLSLKSKEFNVSGGFPLCCFPKVIREFNGFNCVGATLLGVALLDALRVKHYVSNPVNHAINVIESSQDSFHLVDFQNRRVTKTCGNIIHLGDDLRAIKLESPYYHWSLFPLLEPKNIVIAILGNLETIQRVLHDNTFQVSAQHFDQKTIRSFYNRFADHFYSVDLKSFVFSLGGNYINIKNSPLFKEEEGLFLQRVKNKSRVDFDETTVRDK